MRPGRSPPRQTRAGPTEAGRPAATHLAPPGAAPRATGAGRAERARSADDERASSHIRGRHGGGRGTGARPLADGTLRRAIRPRRGRTRLDVDGRVLAPRG